MAAWECFRLCYAGLASARSLRLGSASARDILYESACLPVGAIGLASTYRERARCYEIWQLTVHRTDEGGLHRTCYCALVERISEERSLLEGARLMRWQCPSLWSGSNMVLLFFIETSYLLMILYLIG